MALRYYHGVNTGKGFITHEDQESGLGSISGYPGDIWVTENTVWAERVGVVEKTKEEAQSIVDATLSNMIDPITNTPVSGSMTLP